MADIVASGAELRKRRAADRRARILASSTARMAVVEGQVDSKLVRPEAVAVASVAERASSADSTPPSTPLSFATSDHHRKRLNAAYYVALMAFWVAAGVTDGVITWLRFVLAQATFALLAAAVQQALSKKCENRMEFRAMDKVLCAADLIVRLQRFVRDAVNGLAVVIFICVMRQQPSPLWNSCSSGVADECAL